MTRRAMREHCFKMLFGLGFHSSEETKEQVEQYFKSPDEEELTPEGVDEILHQTAMSEAEQTYLSERVGMVWEKIEVLDHQINEVAEGWKTKRMGRVELTILRLALFEMQYDETVPQKVAINEAVDLAKKFGGKESPSFINGVLAKLVVEE